METLREHEMLSCLRMLHFHRLQVTAIQSFQEALREAGRVFVELLALGGSDRVFRMSAEGWESTTTGASLP